MDTRERKNNNTLKYVLILIIALFAIISINSSLSRLTYLEYNIQNQQQDGYTELVSNGEVLEQDFIAPYNLLHGVSVQIGTFARDNNSTWKIYIKDKSTNDVLYEEEFNGGVAVDGAYHVFEFKKNIKVEEGKLYQVGIEAIDVSNSSSLAFYNLKDDQATDVNLYHNGLETSGKLCFTVYGGNIDYWWIGYTLVLTITLAFILFRGYNAINKGSKLVNDKLLISFILGFLVLITLSIFASVGSFPDEYDNMNGGLIIANGGVIYRDYVTQHTPVTYYLCSIFALFGASSKEQFRLSYYIFEAIFWGLIYFRHSETIGKLKLFALPFVKVVIMVALMGSFAYEILSDAIQGLCMIALLLEFFKYYEDRKLDWTRSIIVSLCFWGSFGAAFVSAFALIWVILAVLIVEIGEWKKSELSFKLVYQRYYKLLVAIFVPLICAVAYFGINHSLKIAFEQFYLFNRDVYPNYQPFGNSVFTPFIYGISKTTEILYNNFDNLLHANASMVNVLQTLVLSLAIGATLIVSKNRKVEGIVVLLVMCYSATRDYGLHGMAAWYVAIMVIVIFGDEFANVVSKKFTIGVIIVIALISGNLFIWAVAGAISEKQMVTTPIENKVIELTEENEEIFVDFYTANPIYLQYKNREIINRVTFVLPWYMDWYETYCIEDLNEHMPKVVVYNDQIEVWGHTNFSMAFVEELNKNYTRLSDTTGNETERIIWIRNN